MSEKLEAAPEIKEDKIQDYEVESAMNDIIRAHKHRGNSKLMAEVKKKLGAHREAIESIEDLREKRNESFTSKKA